MKLCRLIPLVILAAALSGCVTNSNHPTLLTVNFPEVKLGQDEYIQQVQLHIIFAQVATINFVPDDWNLAMNWDNPSEQYVDLQARHFVSGLPDVRRLNGCVTIAVDQTNAPYFGVSAVLTTEKTEPAGGGGRSINLSNQQMTLNPAPRR